MEALSVSSLLSSAIVEKVVVFVTVVSSAFVSAFPVIVMVLVFDSLVIVSVFSADAVKTVTGFRPSSMSS